VTHYTCAKHIKVLLSKSKFILKVFIMRKILGKVMLTLSILSLPVVATAATVNMRDLFTNRFAKSDVLRWVNKGVYTKLVRFKKAVKVLGTLTANNLHVTGTSTFDEAIDADMIEPIDTDHTTTVTTAGVTSGFIKYKEISGDDLQAVLDGTSQTVATFNENDFVLDIVLRTTSSDQTGTVDVGVDANWENNSVDDATFIADHSLSGAAISHMATFDEANQADSARGMMVLGTTGDITIKSTVDMTSDSVFDGNLIIEYISL
jgi:hypothetical protein